MIYRHCPNCDCMMDDCTLYMDGKEYHFLECPVCDKQIPIDKEDVC